MNNSKIMIGIPVLFLLLVALIGCGPGGLLLGRASSNDNAGQPSQPQGSASQGFSPPEGPVPPEGFKPPEGANPPGGTEFPMMGFGMGGDAAVAVTTIRASSGSIAQSLKLGGEVVTQDSVNAFADIAGKVSSILVDVADTVSKGQVIAKVDPSRPGQEYTESSVQAPIGGTVTAVPIRVGETISNVTPIATIGRLDALEIETHIPERFISQVRIGTPAVISLAAWPGETFEASVVELSPVVNPTSRTLEATLVLNRYDGRIKSGMYASVQLITQEKHGIITLPSDCVVTRDGHNVVYVVAEDKAVERPVQLGISAEGMAEIVNGVAVDEEIVCSGQSLLSDGAQVQVIDSEGTGGDA